MLVDAVAGSATYSQLKTQSSAVKGLPSCQTTPFLSCHVTDLPSLAMPPFCAVGISAARTGDEVAVRIPGGQRLVEDARAVLVLGADGEVRVEERRALPPEGLERAAAAPLGRLVRRAWAGPGPRRPRPASGRPSARSRPSPTMAWTKWRRLIRPALTSAIIDRSARSSIGNLLQMMARLGAELSATRRQAARLGRRVRSAMTNGWPLIVSLARRVKRCPARAGRPPRLSSACTSRAAARRSSPSP